MDQSAAAAQNMRTKYVPLLDIAPLEIIDKEDDEDFINAAAVENINQIDLVIHIIHHDIIYQYWSLKSEGDSGPSACNHQHHRDSHHLRDGDDDEEMIMINCQPANTPIVLGKLLLDRGVFASYDDDDDDDQIQDAVVNDNADNEEDHADNNNDDDYIMSLLHDLDALFESERIRTYKHLQEMKRCITQRISEAKTAVLIAKPKRVRIRVHLGTILKEYYANSAAANSAAARNAIELRIRDEIWALSDHVPSQQRRNPGPPQSAAARSSKEALKTKTFEKEDLISSSSSSCPVCWIEFSVGVDEIMIMPCSHVFHSTCLWDWLAKTNTCPLCHYELPTRQLPSSRWNRLPIN